MKLKSLLILLVITTVLAGLSTFMLRPKASKQAQMGALLLPELPVNEIARVTLTTAEDSVVLAKGKDFWQVENRYNYAADFGKLSEFVRKLSKLKIGRSFAGSAETFERLQLVDPTKTDADPTKTAMKVNLSDTAGKNIATYLLGSARDSESGSGGQYLRQAEGDTIYLVDESFRFLKKTPADWLQQDLLDIKETQIRQVDCYPPGSDQPRFQVARPEKAKPATLLNAPSDRKLDPLKVEQLLGALAPLKIKDLAGERQDPPAAMGDGLHLTYRLYNGQQIHIYPRKQGEGDASRYEVQAFITYEAPPQSEQAEAATAEAAETEAVKKPEQNEVEDENKDKDGEAAEAKTQPPSAEEMQALTVDLAAKVSGWTFVLEQWQWQSFITEVEGLLEAIEKAEKGADP